MRSLQMLMAVVIIGAVLPAAMAAQTIYKPAGARIVNHDFSKLYTLVPGTPLEIDTAEGRLFLGKFVVADANGLTLRIDIRLETFKREDIAHVHSYEFERFRYSFIGTAFGGFAGLFFTTNKGLSAGQRGAALGLGSAIGGLGGALVGGARRVLFLPYEPAR